MSCSFLVTANNSDCEMTTTSTPTTTEEQSCKADSKKREDMCLARDTREKCEKSSSCVEWISGPDADDDLEAGLLLHRPISAVQQEIPGGVHCDGH